MEAIGTNGLTASETAVVEKLGGEAGATFARLNSIQETSADQVGFAGLTSIDFIRLLVAELQNQDPLDPVGNEQLVNQLSSMQTLQSNVELSKAIEQMAQAFSTSPISQQLSTAASFIGQSITGADSLTGTVDRAFLQGGEAFVGIGGLEFSLEGIASVNTSQSLVGRFITGRDASNQPVIGLVDTAFEDAGEHFVRVDGAAVRLDEVTSVNTANSLVGKVVTVVTEGAEFTGLVGRATNTGSGAKIAVNNKDFALSDVVSIKVGTRTLP